MQQRDVPSNIATVLKHRVEFICDADEIQILRNMWDTYISRGLRIVAIWSS